MQIVPVLDLMQEHVVRARGGEREQYRPIETPLAATSDPLDVARGLLALHPFSTLYVADLDAIAGRGDNAASIERLRRAHPSLRLWVDAGIGETAAAHAWLSRGLGDLVLGSETLRDARVTRDLRDDDRVVLSLDFRGDAFQGPAALLDAPALWPKQVIVMTLGRVGRAEGPDHAMLASLQGRRADRAYYVAGGVRDAADLAALSRNGAAGVLVASALHDGRIRGSDLAPRG